RPRPMAESLAWALPGAWHSRTRACRSVARRVPASEGGIRRELQAGSGVDKPALPTARAGLADVDEAALVDACLAGHPGAFDVIVERHRRAVYQLCHRFVGNHEDASDLSQDVFLRAYRGLKNFRGQSTLATWLYRIGVNVCLNRVSVKVLPSEPIESDQHVDVHSESPAERVLRDER